MRPTIVCALVALSLAACNTVQSEVDREFVPSQPERTEVAVAQPAVRNDPLAKGAHKDAGRYFVEFRSRSALSYGHTFLVHGRLNQKGQVGELTDKNVAGFHPAGATPELWTIGHVVPVTAETGPSDGDLEEEYVTARFRVYLSEEEYNRFRPHLKEKQASNAMWHAVTNNCNVWVGEIAQFMGLKAPNSSWLYPADYIIEMGRLNTSEETASSSVDVAPALR
ncbi:MAG: hypothetical protein ABWZ80_11555 [Beijerinckiaceae bacterium]